MSKFDVAKNQAPKMFLRGVSLNLGDVDSSGHLLTGSGTGNSAPPTQGPKTELTGPSGYVADVDNNGNVLTTNG